MKLQGVVAEPVTPRHVIGPTLGDERPESWAVTEDAEVGQLVDHHGLERLWWGEDEPPGERQAPVT